MVWVTPFHLRQNGQDMGIRERNRKPAQGSPGWLKQCLLCAGRYANLQEHMPDDESGPDIEGLQGLQSFNAAMVEEGERIF